MANRTLWTDDEEPLSRQRVGEEVAAEHLGVSKYALRKWRKHGGGPRLSKPHKNCVRYTVGALDEFIAERETQKAIQRMTSSCDPRVAVQAASRIRTSAGAEPACSDDSPHLGCCRFRGHPVKVESETGGRSWERDGNSVGSSSLRP
jgi:hypothetical protein